MIKEVANIFNIILSNPVLFRKKTGTLDLNIQSFKTCYPSAEYTLYNNRTVCKIIANNFDKDVLDAYNQLVPYAYKADLARYCILYLKGGVYSDISHLHINPMNIEENTELVFFRDIAFIHPAFAVSNAVIYADPGQEDLYNIIYRIVENCNARFHGHHPLDPTGPYLLGKYLAKLDSHKNIVFGDSTAIVVGENPNASQKHIIKFMPDGNLITFRNKRINSSIDEFIQGGNSYGDLWAERKVYRE